MKTGKQKNFLFIALSILCLLAIGEVYAVWTQELSVKNELRMAQYSTEIINEFRAPDNWLPGQKVKDIVAIENKGTVPVFAYVDICQSWQKVTDTTDELDGLDTLNNDDDLDVAKTDQQPSSISHLPLSFESEDGRVYASVLGWSNDVVLLSQGKKSDVGFDIPCVDSVKDAEGKWLMLTDKVNDEGCLRLYYIGTIETMKSSPTIIESVTLNRAVENEIKSVSIWYDSQYQKNIEETLSAVSYEKAQYDLDVTAYTLQATTGAIRDILGETEGAKEVVDYLASTVATQKGGTNEKN